MQRGTLWILVGVGAAIMGVLVLVFVAAGFYFFRATTTLSSVPPTAVSVGPMFSAMPMASALDPNNLMVETPGEADARVKAVFPNGPATEDVRSEIGTAPAPPADGHDAGVPSVAQIQRVFKVRSKYADDALEIGVVVSAPAGTKFPGRKVWDAVYSAGFSWGDGDYFHWVPSDDTDVGQGISMGTSTGAGYFLPESLNRTDGSADVDDVEMSFDLARVWHPVEVFDVMAKAAAYFARRLGGTMVTSDGKPFDAKATRAHVAAIAKELEANGLVPGSATTLQFF